MPQLDWDRPVEWVTAERIRLVFNERSYSDKAKSGLITEHVKRNSHVKPPPKGEPECTHSQIVYYYTPEGKPLAVVHLYRRPDGTIGARLGDLRAKNPSMQIDEESFLREAELAAGHAPVQYGRIRRVNLGDPAPADELLELELGKNECAMSRR